jgi:DNA-binding NarL/FixJ family response regulator
MNSFRILLADDHPIFRLGLHALISSHEDWQVCGEAADGREAVTKCWQLKPDLLILDISMPELNGVDAARQILKSNPAQKILILTDVDSEKVVRDCLEVGIQGWVVKSEGIDDLITAVKALRQNKSIFSSRVSDLIREDSLRHRTAAAGSVLQLSKREREVVQLLAEGKTSKEVASILECAVKTAETHRSNLMRKLNLHSIAELVLYAVRNEIVNVQLPSVLSVPVVPLPTWVEVPQAVN